LFTLTVRCAARNPLLQAIGRTASVNALVVDGEADSGGWTAARSHCHHPAPRPRLSRSSCFPTRECVAGAPCCRAPENVCPECILWALRGGRHHLTIWHC
jgi:hypothetical protein